MEKSSKGRELNKRACFGQKTGGNEEDENASQNIHIQGNILYSINLNIPLLIATQF